MNQHVAIRTAKVDIQRVVASLKLCPGFDDDERLTLDMLEGETELNEIVSKLLEENEADEGLIEALKAQVEVRKVRRERVEARIEARKSAIVSLMDCAQLRKLPLPEATISIRTLMPRPKVMDAEQLPDAFVILETIRKPDTEAIAVAVEQGVPIPGVAMTNGGTSLSVRRK